MKKIIFLLIVCSTFLSGYSQESKITFGIRGGVGYANLTNTGHIHARYSYKQHVQLGVFSEIKIIKPLFLQVELLFSNPGTRLYQINNGGYKTKDSIFNFNCLQLPIQAKIKIGNGSFKGYYMLGVAPSFLINANVKNKLDSTSTTFFNFTPYENRFTTNMVNTIGFEIDIDELVIPFVDFRYVQGLSSIHKATDLKGITNLQFLLSIGVKF